MAQILAGYDAFQDVIKVSSVQNHFRESFGGAAVDATKWDTVTGAGGSLSVASGQLTLASGTTAGSETYLMSKQGFTIPVRIAVGMSLSQRIVNQGFYIELISVDPVTFLPDGKHKASWLFDGVTATQAKYIVQNSAVTALTSSAVTVTTTASLSVIELEPFADEAWFHSAAIDSTNGRTSSYRRHRQIPDPNAIYRIRLRWLNGGSAPASSSNAIIQYVSAQDYVELTAEITAGRGNTVAGSGIFATVAGTVTSTEGTFLAPSEHLLNSAATTNATSVKASAGTIFAIAVSNHGAAIRYLKFYNKASAPTVGTDTPIIVIPIPIGGVVILEGGKTGHRFTTGIAYAITGAAADADTTAIGAGEVKVMMAYI